MSDVALVVRIYLLERIGWETFVAAFRGALLGRVPWLESGARNRADDAVAEILFGRDAGWQVQRRDDGAVSHRDIVSTYSVPTLIGVAMAVSAYAVSLPLLLSWTLIGTVVVVASWPT